MSSNNPATTIPEERRFDRGAWLVLLFALIFIVLDLGAARVSLFFADRRLAGRHVVFGGHGRFSAYSESCGRPFTPTAW